MPTFEDPVEIRRPWSDWIFLRQHRNVESNGGFHIHNPWGNSDQPQGVPARNRLEVAYRTPAGQDLWAQFVLHGPTGRIGLGTGDPQAHMDVVNPWGDWLFLRQQRDVDGGGGFHIHNPWGNTSQPQGDGSRNRLEIGYQTASGQHLWGQWVIHGPTGNVGIGTTAPSEKLEVDGNIKLPTANRVWTTEKVFNVLDYGATPLTTKANGTSGGVTNGTTFQETGKFSGVAAGDTLWIFTGQTFGWYTIDTVPNADLVTISGKTFPVTTSGILKWQVTSGSLASKDCTTVFQDAINDAELAGGGVVHVPAGHYYFTSHLSVGKHVLLRGVLGCPPSWDHKAFEASPGTVQGSVLMPTETGDTSFITLAGMNAGVEGLTFFYPWQYSTGWTQLTIDSSSITADEITINATSEHNLAAGDLIVVYGAGTDTVNGAYGVKSVTDSDTFVVKNAYGATTGFGPNIGTVVKKGFQTYPWCIRGGTSSTNDNHYTWTQVIRNIMLVNAYQGIDFGFTDNILSNGRHIIDGVFGCPLNIGINVDKSLDIGRISNVHFHPDFWLTEDAAENRWWALLGYLLKNGTGLSLKRADVEFVSNFFTFHYRTGIKLDRGEAGQTWEGAAAGCFSNITIDCSVVGIDAEYSQGGFGQFFSNLNVVTGAAATGCAGAITETKTAIKIAGTHGPAPFQIAGGALFACSGQGTAAHIDVDGGTLFVTGCKFDANATYSINRDATSSANVVEIGNELLAPLGNMGYLGTPGDLRIVNASPHLTMYETDAGADARQWTLYAQDSEFVGIAANDAASGAQAWVRVKRSAQYISSVNFENGNVGIGTTTPATKLDVNGGIYMRGNGSAGLNIGATGGANYIESAGAGMADASSADLHFTNMNAHKIWMTITSGGNVGVGCTAPNHKFAVSDGNKSNATQAIFGQGRTSGNSRIVIGGQDASNKSVNIDYNHASNYGSIQIGGDPVGTALVIADGGKVGIGTTDIKRQLHVEGLEIHSGGRVAGFSFSNRGSAWSEDGGNGERWAWYSSGKVARLWSGGDKLSIDGAGNFTVKNGNALKPGGGPWGSISDKRLKKNIAPLAGVLDKLLQLRGVTYEWKEPEKHGNLTGPQMGLVAQEVEAVFPEWVGAESDGNKTLTIRGFEALTIEALREVNQRIGEIEKRNEQFLKTFEAQAKVSKK